MQSPTLRNFSALAARAKADGVLHARLLPAEPPRPVAAADMNGQPIRKAEPSPVASVMATEKSASETLPAATSKPVLIQGPSLRELEALASWTTSKVDLTIYIAESGSVENIETRSDVPLPSETVAGIKRVFANVRFIPAKRNSVPIKSIVTITVTIEPSELYPSK